MKILPEALRDGVPYPIRGRIKIDRMDDWLPFDRSGVYGRDKQPKEKGTAT